MTQYILTANEATTYSEQQLGGKAYNLVWLHRHGFPVPAFLVVNTLATQAVLAHNALTHWIAQKLTGLAERPDTIATTLHDIRERLLMAALPEALQAELRHGVQTLGETHAFAVRSSVVGEDSRQASFAGQMDSFLFQQGFEAISAAYIKCLASAFSERAYRYRLEKKLTIFPIEMAVIMQTMIDGEVSGVLCTAHPLTGQRDHFLISACYGIGEGVVSGSCNTDEFTLTATGEEISRHIAMKDCQIAFDRRSGTGTIACGVEATRQQAPCLTATQIESLMAHGRAISGLQGCPQDIEWTIDGDHIAILQTRPITTLPPPQTPRGRRVVWDNSNIQESYCGVTTPLTFSFASRAYQIVYTQTMRMLNLSEKVIQEHRKVLTNMLGLIHGRVYYNINSWYACLLQGPSFRTNKQDMERMMGLQDPVDFVQTQPLSWSRKVAKIRQLASLLLRLPWIFRHMPKRVQAFEAMFAQVYDRMNRADLHRLEISQLMDMADMLHESLLYKWHTPILNDIYVMIMNGRISRQLRQVQAPEPEALQNHLLAGEAGLESTEPTKYLLRLCDEIRRHPEVLKAFEQYQDAHMLAMIQMLDTTLYEHCLAYIERYGDRTIGELKLESLSLRQDSSFMFSILRNFLKNPELTADSFGRKEQALRQAAEREALMLVKNHRGRLGLWRFKRNLRCLRQAIVFRESMRMARTRLFGLFRDIYGEVGQQMAFYGILAEARDVFYLTVEELEAYHEGRAVQPQFAPLVAARKAAYASYEREELPHHFVTHGAVYHHNTYAYEGVLNPNPSQDGTLQGIGCYPGVVRERVKLIFSPTDQLDLAGQILCTLRTDPGWAPLFPSAGGIVVERGSTLSHSAIVARELGIPAIVGVPGITNLVRTGDWMTMDGARGTVKLEGASIANDTPQALQLQRDDQQHSQ